MSHRQIRSGCVGAAICSWSTPFLIWFSVAKTRHKSELTPPTFVLVLLVATYVLTIWQARWGYFFALIFALALPPLLEPIKSRGPFGSHFSYRSFRFCAIGMKGFGQAKRNWRFGWSSATKSVQLRDLALSLRSSEIRPFLAPWWLSPSIAYWSGQPGIAGSSHESLDGIEDSARFFLCDDWQKARQILQNHKAAWVFAYDSERVAQNSAAILNQAAPAFPLCRVLDRTPGQVPPFLIFAAQNGTCKLYRAIAE